MHQPHPPITQKHPAYRISILILLLLTLLACKKPTTEIVQELPGERSPPATAAHTLAQHLHNNDWLAYAKTAVPPEQYQQLKQAWDDGYSRWPLTELPLADQIPTLLETLAQPDAEALLQQRFTNQIQGQEQSIQHTALFLETFGLKYLYYQSPYTPEQKNHYMQTLKALKQWSTHAPLTDPALAQQSITRLTKAAQDSGLHSEDDFEHYGMEESLRRIGPFFAELKTVTALYGLSLDDSFNHLHIGLINENNNQALINLHYPLANTPIEATMTMTRQQNRWYLDTDLQQAEAVALLMQQPIEAEKQSTEKQTENDPETPPTKPTPTTNAPISA